MRKHVIAAGAVSVAGLLVASLGGSAWSQPQSTRHNTTVTRQTASHAGEPTLVEAISPFTSTGAVKPGWRVKTIKPSEGKLSCLTRGRPSASQSSVSGDVYYCGVSAQGADVCWIKPKHTHALCGTEPWRHTLLRWTLKKSPVPRVAAVDKPLPWGLVLHSGTKCRIRNGGAWGGRSDGWIPEYSCTKPNVYVLVSPHRPHHVVTSTSHGWTVKVGNTGNPQHHFPPPRTVKVTEAYFATSE